MSIKLDWKNTNCGECGRQMQVQVVDGKETWTSALITPEVKDLMFKGVAKGAFRCGACGRYTCFECSHGTLPCRCGSLSWGEVIYLEGGKRSWWTRIFRRARSAGQRS